LGVGHFNRKDELYKLFAAFRDQVDGKGFERNVRGRAFLCALCFSVLVRRLFGRDFGVLSVLAAVASHQKERSGGGDQEHDRQHSRNNNDQLLASSWRRCFCSACLRLGFLGHLRDLNDRI
jgi:hypothetical protein